MQTSHLIAPHGGMLKNLYLAPEQARAEKEKALEYHSWDLTPRQLCDIELLLNGAFSPLEGFLCRNDYQQVLEHMRLGNGTLWPLPITLDVTPEFADTIGAGGDIALRDAEGLVIAIMHVSDIWRPDFMHEADACYGTKDPLHPGVDYLFNHSGKVYLGGRLYGIEAPVHYDFQPLRHTPSETREIFTKRGWTRAVAFQTRNPMHKAHHELTFRAAQQAEANLLIQPVVGMTKPGDVDHYTRVRCYEKMLSTYPRQTTMLSLLPLAMRMAGPREALWHAIIRKNYGCTHFIVGRDHAGPGKDASGTDFYGPYDAQEMVHKYSDELNIEMVPFRAMVYVKERASYVPMDETRDDETVMNISGTELRERLRDGREIPDWFSYPEVIAELRRSYPPRHQQGFTVFFTGLSGSGKSTIANALLVKMMEIGSRAVTLLDGDLVRKNLSSELGFSREHRNLNILRIGYVASEITKHRGIAICAPIAPYEDVRREVSQMIRPYGGFILVSMATPLEVCEQRDRKGLYAKARAGILKGFTGIDDPYETPEKPDVLIDSSQCSVDEAAQQVLLKLEVMGYLR